jgi:HK97 gp10 family phage protein
LANSLKFSRVDLTGSAEIQRLLRELSLETRGPILSAAVGRAARPIVKIARRLAPRDTGALSASIDSDIRRDKRRGSAYAIVGPTRDAFKAGKRIKGGSTRGAARPANYAHLVEFGHLKVKPIKGTSLRKKTAILVAGLVAARPFLRPAFVAGASLAGAEFAAAIETGIARAVDKLRRRAAA